MKAVLMAMVSIISVNVFALDLQCKVINSSGSSDVNFSVEANDPRLEEIKDESGNVLFKSGKKELLKTADATYFVQLRFSTQTDFPSMVAFLKMDSTGKMVNASQATFEAVLLSFEDYSKDAINLSCFYE